MVKPEAILEVMRLHRVAVQTSVSAAAFPQSAVVGFAVTDQFEIVFDTLESTRKAQNLRTNPQVALVIGGWVPGDERTIQYEGFADEPSGAELDRLKQVYFSVHSDGPDRANWPGLIYVRVKPKWLRYSDFNADPPEIVEYSAADLTR